MEAAAAQNHLKDKMLANRPLASCNNRGPRGAL